ncbi:sulfotransferase family 2 domain-containing protein [uncultured Shimia sp.]|uniref:sulfotransferase family 2 domain-containing protein n=1 Tax=uncultured Shimia sp. TaxID=573152 RepID=UPI0025F20FA8|nr:sulfotransferase family 2 domain-containing protein [uncultured Shimia sp.]
MLVSHTKKFIYIKTVKTAGTSVEVALQDYCLPPDVKLPTENVASDASISNYGIVGARGSDVAQKNEWYNHMPASQIKAQLEPEVWEGYTKICNIRNPWDKTVSWFHFRNPGVKSLPEEEIVAAFRAFMNPEDDSNLTIGLDTHIYFINGVPVADEYIRYDTMSADYNRICQKLDLDAPPIPELKRGPRGKKTVPYQKYYDTELRDRVADIYAKEIDAFGWSF